jgi:uncharacterized membrane protein
MIKQILTKHDRKIVVAIILLASGLRFFNLGARSFWFDEASSIRFARLDAATILTAGGSLGHPPGFYFLLHLWRAAGEGDFWLRFPSAFFGVLSVALTYGLARYLFDRPVAQVSAFWMAISPFQLYYAQEVRMYAMTTAVILGLMWGFFHGVREEDKKGWLAYGVLSVLGFYTYYFVGFVMAALSLWWLLDRRRWKTFGMFFITNGAVALTSAPLLISYISQTNSILAKAVSRGSASTGLARPHILSPFTTLYYLLFSHVFPPKFWVAPGFFCVVGMLALSMLLWARGHHVSAALCIRCARIAQAFPDAVCGSWVHVVAHPGRSVLRGASRPDQAAYPRRSRDGRGADARGRCKPALAGSFVLPCADLLAYARRRAAGCGATAALGLQENIPTPWR